MKKISMCLVLCLLCFAFSVPTKAVSTSAQSAVLINADTGRVIYSQNMNERLPMASTTKIMTALLLAEENTPEKQIVTTREMVTVEGSSMGLLAGDTVTYNDLLYGLMLASGNDAANTTAISISGSLEGFADKMNAKAQDFGLTDTHFVTPSGLDHSDHYSTAYDMAVLTAYALKNEQFAAAAASESARLYYGNPPYYRTLTNHNKLLKMYDGAVGVKTGFTKRSGRCLVSAAKRGNVTLIAVTLNDKNDWNDHMALFDYGFANSTDCTLTPEIPSNITLAEGGSLLITVEPLQLGLSLDDKLEYKVHMPQFLYSGVSAGEIVGYAQVLCGEKTVATLDITAAEGATETAKQTNIYNQIISEFLNLIRSF